jgi:hypothetical protein
LANGEATGSLFASWMRGTQESFQSESIWPPLEASYGTKSRRGIGGALNKLGALKCGQMRRWIVAIRLPMLFTSRCARESRLAEATYASRAIKVARLPLANALGRGKWMMRPIAGCGFLLVVLATLAGCSPYNVDMSLEGINWFVVHPRFYCFEYPNSNPQCPYYDYQQCQWAPDAPQPSVSAINAPAVVPNLDEKSY